MEGDADKIEQGANFSPAAGEPTGFSDQFIGIPEISSMFVNGKSQMRKLIEKPLCLQIRKNLWCPELLDSANFWTDQISIWCLIGPAGTGKPILPRSVLTPTGREVQKIVGKTCRKQERHLDFSPDLEESCYPISVLYTMQWMRSRTVGSPQID